MLLVYVTCDLRVTNFCLINETKILHYLSQKKTLLFSEPKINYGKTSASRVGSERNTKAYIFTQFA